MAMPAATGENINWETELGRAGRETTRQTDRQAGAERQPDKETKGQTDRQTKGERGGNGDIMKGKGRERERKSYSER